MKKILLIMFMSLPLSSFSQTILTPSGQMQYAEFKDPACMNCPIIVFLHGSGEGGYDINKVYTHGLPKLLKNSTQKHIEGFRVIVPQMPAGNWIGKVEDRKIIKFIKWMRTTVPNDSNIFVTGLSMGGLGAWQTSYDLVSVGVRGIVPVGASGSFASARDYTAPRGIAVWALHGSSDNVITPDTGEASVKGMISVNANPKPIFTLIVGGGHNASTWDVAYSLTPRAELGNKTIYDWMRSLIPSSPPPAPVRLDIIKTQFDPGSGRVIFTDSNGVEH